MIDRLDWRLPGCGESCTPRRHDPYAHELHGFLLALRSPPIRRSATGPLLVDLDARSVRVNGEYVEILGGSWKTGTCRWLLIELLALNLGKAVSYSEIGRHVYGSYLDDHATRRAVHQLTYHLRHHLGPAGVLIKSLPGYGVRLEKEPISHA